MRNNFVILSIGLTVLLAGSMKADVTLKSGPSVVPCFDIFEIVLQSDVPVKGNPFTDIEVRAAFTPEGGSPINVDGFCDDQEGRCFRVRFCPSIAKTK